MSNDQRLLGAEPIPCFLFFAFTICKVTTASKEANATLNRGKEE